MVVVEPANQPAGEAAVTEPMSGGSQAEEEPMISIEVATTGDEENNASLATAFYDAVYSDRSKYTGAGLASLDALQERFLDYLSENTFLAPPAHASQRIVATVFLRCAMDSEAPDDTRNANIATAKEHMTRVLFARH